MSKRAQSSPVFREPSSKLTKMDASWAAISEETSSAGVKQPATNSVWDEIPESSGKLKEFTAVDAGPKAKVVKTVVLNYKPKVVLDIGLADECAQLRFTDETHSFTVSADHYMELTTTHLGGFQRVRLEPLDAKDEFRLAKYNRTPSGMSELEPIEVFRLSKYAARRLKAKHNEIMMHALALMQNEDVFLTMYCCINKVYLDEYARLNSLRPISEHMDELSTIVGMYVPAVVIVKAFVEKLQEKQLVSRFNHYNVLAVCLLQKDYICELLTKH